MNYMKQVADMLGVELEEEFRIKGTTSDVCDNRSYKITEGGLWFRDNNKPWFPCGEKIIHLLNGNCEVIKKEWKLTDGTIYYYVNTVGKIGTDIFYSTNRYDRAIYYMGNCFGTPEEAGKHREEVLEKFKTYESEG